MSRTSLGLSKNSISAPRRRRRAQLRAHVLFVFPEKHLAPYIKNCRAAAIRSVNEPLEQCCSCFVFETQQFLYTNWVFRRKDKRSSIYFSFFIYGFGCLANRARNNSSEVEYPTCMRKPMVTLRGVFFKTDCARAVELRYFDFLLAIM